MSLNTQMGPDRATPPASDSPSPDSDSSVEFSSDNDVDLDDTASVGTACGSASSPRVSALLVSRRSSELFAGSVVLHAGDPDAESPVPSEADQGGR